MKNRTYSCYESRKFTVPDQIQYREDGSLNEFIDAEVVTE